MWLVWKYMGIRNQPSLQQAGDCSVRYWASSLHIMQIRESPDCLEHSEVQRLQQGDVVSGAYFFL